MPTSSVGVSTHASPTGNNAPMTGTITSAAGALGVNEIDNDDDAALDNLINSQKNDQRDGNGPRAARDNAVSPDDI